jgi:hypothetical protein
MAKGLRWSSAGDLRPDQPPNDSPNPLGLCAKENKAYAMGHVLETGMMLVEPPTARGGFAQSGEKLTVTAGSPRLMDYSTTLPGPW